MTATETAPAESMRALALLGDDRVELREFLQPVPGPGEALVRIEASALCGSERAALQAGGSGNTGHEAAGIVVSAPPGSPSPVGTRVGIAALAGCGRCGPCAAGLETRCTAGPHSQLGMHADYAAVPVRTLRALPDGIDPIDAVLVSGDALGVPTRALRRVATPLGGRVLIVGLGPVGLAHVLLRAADGAEVLGIEPSALRRQLAAELGASFTVAPGEPLPTPSPALVIESTGRPQCLAEAFRLVADGGTVLQSGECSTAEIRPSRDIVHREITYTGSWYYTSADYPEMLARYSAGLALRSLVTHVVAAEEAQRGVDAFLSAASGKVVITWT